MALGSYPDVSLKAVRLARAAAKRDRDAGIDLVQARKLAKLKSVVAVGERFRATALEWYGKNEARRGSHYAIREMRNLEKNLFPYFAERRISEIQPIELLRHCAALKSAERWTWRIACYRRRGQFGDTRCRLHALHATSPPTSRRADAP